MIIYHVQIFKTFYKNNTRNSKFKLSKEFAESRPRTNFLTLRVFDYWNSLTEDTRAADTILKFKINIDRELDRIMFDYIE